jgi:hypothetical protein
MTFAFLCINSELYHFFSIMMVGPLINVEFSENQVMFDSTRIEVMFDSTRIEHSFPMTMTGARRVHRFHYLHKGRFRGELHVIYNLVPRVHIIKKCHHYAIKNSVVCYINIGRV